MWRAAEQPGEQARLWVRAPPLVTRRQASVLAGCQHTIGVSVPPKLSVAFGCDQDVLAQSGQVLAAERAAVGRWLQVPGGTCRPPARRAPVVLHHAKPRSFPPGAALVSTIGSSTNCTFAALSFDRDSVALAECPHFGSHAACNRPTWQDLSQRKSPVTRAFRRALCRTRTGDPLLTI